MKRLLLVDDEPRNLELLVEFLSPHGYDLVTARDGPEAIERFTRDGADLVLSDVILPNADGFEVLRRVRAHERFVPVILMTAAAEREHRLRGIELGANEFLEKPIDRAILVARVRTLLAFKEANDALHEKNAALERLQRHQVLLTSFLVHDLKNHVGVMQANLAWVRETLQNLGEDVAEALDDTIDSAARLGQMAADMLVVARIEDAELVVQPTDVALTRLVQDVAHARMRDIAEKLIDLSVACDEGVRALGDEGLLRRVVENLIDNATRYTPMGGKIEAHARRAGREAEVSVSNTGTPIPADRRERLFDKLTQDQGVTGPGHVGLGLYFCAMVVKAHGGSIAVESSAPWATTFRVRLPAP